jgi:hypothetical protein
VTSAEIVCEFVMGRPDLELEVRREMTDGFRAPEAFASVAFTLITDSMKDRNPSPEEQAGINRMRGNGNVDWNDVARHFGARIS